MLSSDIRIVIALWCWLPIVLLMKWSDCAVCTFLTMLSWAIQRRPMR
jgi:hypothetical protein